MLNKLSSYSQQILTRLIPKDRVRWTNILAVAGLSIISYKVLSCLWSIDLPGGTKYFDINKYGSGFVVITGCTEGIGRAFARFFARNGCDLFLVSRNLERLEEFKKELLDQFKGIQVRVLAVEFGECFAEGFQQKLKPLLEVKVSVLVNNVGNLWRGSYSVMPFDQLRQLLSVNIGSQVFMTRTLLPHMLRSPKTAIINISSITHEGAPYLTIYSSSKGFNTIFSKALSIQLLDKVDCISINPSAVASRMSKGMEHFWKVDTDDFVHVAISKLGRRKVWIGHWKHRLLNFIESFMGDRAKNRHFKELFNIED